MKTIVVYESLWGNTATIARAIAEGFGPEARVFSTAEATREVLSGADLIVAGSPLFAFQLPTEKIRETIRSKAATFPTPPNLSHPSLRSWLETVPPGKGRCAAFETRIWWSPGGAIGTIQKALQAVGYEPLMRGKRFRVVGMHGPLKAGEMDRAREWGERLAGKMES